MANILIYSGLGIMLLGALYGIFVAVKGIERRKESGLRNVFCFRLGSVQPQMKKLITIYLPHCTTHPILCCKRRGFYSADSSPLINITPGSLNVIGRVRWKFFFWGV